MTFDSVHNYQEQAIYHAVLQCAPQYPALASSQDLLADVACVALNRLPPKYIRNDVDMAFYISNSERAEQEAAVQAAVDYAFKYVQSRAASNSR